MAKRAKWIGQAVIRLLGLWIAGVSLMASPGAVASWEPPPPWKHSDEYLIVPLRIHVLRSERYLELNCTLTDQDVTRILGKVNQIWAQAGIQFYLESLRREPANDAHVGVGPKPQAAALLLSLRPPDSLGEGMFDVFYVHALAPGLNGVSVQRDGIFIQELASLKPVPEGIDEPIPRVTAHELGHQFLLNHHPERGHLMASGTTGIRLTAPEIHQARAGARKFSWILSPAAAFDRTTEVKRETGLAILRCLSQIPCRSPLQERAAERLRQWEAPPPEAPAKSDGQK